MTTAIIVAAGKSTRMGRNVDKTFLALGSKPVVAWSLLAFEKCREIDRIVLVVRRDQLVAAKALGRMFGIAKLQSIVAGGAKRQDSVLAGLAACDPDTRIVVVHDGARPLVKPETISACVQGAVKFGAVTVGHHMIDTVKEVKAKGDIAGTVDRSKLWQVQTPQAFQIAVLRGAYKALATEVTDDCQAVELAGAPVKVIESNAINFKITTADDMQLAAALLK